VVRQINCSLDEILNGIRWPRHTESLANAVGKNHSAVPQEIQLNELGDSPGDTVSAPVIPPAYVGGDPPNKVIQTGDLGRLIKLIESANSGRKAILIVHKISSIDLLVLRGVNWLSDRIGSRKPATSGEPLPKVTALTRNIVIPLNRERRPARRAGSEACIGHGSVPLVGFSALGEP
jgi:hypothetical protein